MIFQFLVLIDTGVHAIKINQTINFTGDHCYVLVYVTSKIKKVLFLSVVFCLHFSCWFPAPISQTQSYFNSPSFFFFYI